MPGRRVVILGATGMLGSMVLDFFAKTCEFDLIATYRNHKDGKLLKNKYPKVDFRKLDVEKANLKSMVNIVKNADWLINTTGIIKPYIHDDNPEEAQKAILVNSFFPHLLASVAKNTGSKVIQIATDCVYSGQKGQYVETDHHDGLDVYGKTKSLGEVISGNFLNIRCSIIGPEKGRKTSLLEWFLSQSDRFVVKGFTHHRWNGVTTLQFAKLCSTIILEDRFDDLIKASHTHHFVPNNALTKFDLLTLFAKVFKKNIKVVPVDIPPPAVDRTLSTRYSIISSLFPSSTIEEAIEQLKEYMQ